MRNETEILLRAFQMSKDDADVAFSTYKCFDFVLNMISPGVGPVGENGYLILWEKNVLENRNDDYMVSTFLDDVFLIGSDGGDNAFGVNKEKNFIVVPFMDMCNENVKVLSNTFDGFIKHVSECDY